MLKVTRPMVDLLVKKLKYWATTRSINLNCNPWNLNTRLDLKSMDKFCENFSKDFLDNLLNNQEFSLEFSIKNPMLSNTSSMFNEQSIFSLQNEDNLEEESTGDNDLKKKYAKMMTRCRSIFFQREDDIREHWYDTFWFWFPVVLVQDPASAWKVIQAPLLIWDLWISKTWKKDTYKITKNEDMTIWINEVLLWYLESNHWVKLSRLSDEMLDDGLIDSEELIEIISNLLKDFKVEEPEDDIFIDQPIEFPTSPTMKKNATTKPKVLISWVFSLYKKQKHSIIVDTEKVLEEFDWFFDSFDEWEENILEYDHSFSSVMTDPSQQWVLNRIDSSDWIVIQGPPWTWKSQTLTWIITNALDNQLKILVVCEKNTAMAVLKSNLTRIWLWDLAVIVENVWTNRKNVVNHVRDVTDNDYKIWVKENIYEYSSLITKAEELKVKINSKHDFLNKQLMKWRTWNHIVGQLFTLSHDSKEISKIYSRFKSLKLSFDFTDEEYSNLLDVVKNARELIDISIFESWWKNVNLEYIKSNSTKHISHWLNEDIPILKEKLQKVNKLSVIQQEKVKIINESAPEFKTLNWRLKESVSWYDYNHYHQVAKTVDLKVSDNIHQSLSRVTWLWSILDTLQWEISTVTSALKSRISESNRFKEQVSKTKNTERIDLTLNNADWKNKYQILIWSENWIERFYKEFVGLDWMNKTFMHWKVLNKISKKLKNYLIIGDLVKMDAFKKKTNGLYDSVENCLSILLVHGDESKKGYEKIYEIINGIKESIEMIKGIDKTYYSESWIGKTLSIWVWSIFSKKLSSLKKEFSKIEKLDDQLETLLEDSDFWIKVDSYKTLQESFKIIEDIESKIIAFEMNEKSIIDHWNWYLSWLLETKENNIKDLNLFEEYSASFKWKGWFKSDTEFHWSIREYINNDSNEYIKLIESDLEIINEIKNHISSNQDSVAIILAHQESLDKLENEYIKYLNWDACLIASTELTDVALFEYMWNSINFIESNKDSLNKYIVWKKFYHWLEPIPQKIIKHFLKNIKKEDLPDLKNISNDRERQLKVGYLEQLLIASKEDIADEEIDATIDELKEIILKIRRMQVSNIAKKRNDERSYRIDEYKMKYNSTVKQLYNKRWTWGEKRNSLRKIIDRDLWLFTSMFPVLMMNPSTACSTLPLKKDLFDLVIFDEASQIRLEDTFSCMLRWTKIIIAWDSHQTPPSRHFQASFVADGSDMDGEEDESDEYTDIEKDIIKNSAYKESLLEYGIETWFEITYLNSHYRSQHPALIDFSNAAFYKSRLIPMPAKNSYNIKPIQFIQVDWVYDNLNKININADEADAIIELLIKIWSEESDEHCWINWKPPGILIATFNVNQRNLIKEKLFNIKNWENPRDARIISLLEDNWMLVRNLENIQWDERDVVIISTTYWKKEDWSFAQRYWTLNQRVWYRYLNVLITRAKYKEYVFCSIPTNYYLNFREKIETKWSYDWVWAFYAFLSYCKAISEWDQENVDEILQVLRAGKEHSEHISYTESPFEEEVLYEIEKIVWTNRIIPQYKCWWFRLDFAIKDKNTWRPFIALECDGAAFHSSDIQYSHDLYRQSILENQWFTFIRIRSTDRWNDKDKVLDSIYNRLKKMNQIGDLNAETQPEQKNLYVEAQSEQKNLNDNKDENDVHEKNDEIVVEDYF